MAMFELQMVLEWSGKDFDDVVFEETGRHSIKVELDGAMDWVYFWSRSQRKWLLIDALPISQKIYFKIQEAVEQYLIENKLEFNVWK